MDSISNRIWLTVTIKDGETTKTVEVDFPFDRDNLAQAFANAETFAKDMLEEDK